MKRTAGPCLLFASSLAVVVLCQFLGTSAALSQSSPAPPTAGDLGDPPLPKAHAHNDYLHPRPLLDALSHGFCSVEADVFLVQDELLVGHEANELTRERTLEALYLRPLWKRYRETGRIYAADRRLTLLIDFKSEAESTYDALDELLIPYREMLVRYDNENRTDGPVEVILSGNRPIEAVRRQDQRWVAIDGRLSDLASNPPVTLMPLVSDRWTQHFFWNGEDPISTDDAQRLKMVVKETHQQGRRLRFWATPDRPTAWKLLEEEQVDFINTDDLSGLAHFLRSKEAKNNTATGCP